MQLSTTPTRRRARRARVAKTVTSQALGTGGKLEDASLPGGSGITELWGLAVSKTAAADILAGKVKAIAKTTDRDLTGRAVVLAEGRAVGEVELAKSSYQNRGPVVWDVKSVKAYERPKPTNIPTTAAGVVGGVRLLERLKSTRIEEPVTKQRAKTYNPRPVVDSVLLADVRALREWNEEAALKKALAEVDRRGLQLPKLELAPETEPETLTTTELVEAHRALHVAKGWNSEDAVNMHAQVVAELADRGIPHPEPPPGLDQQSKPLEPGEVEITKAAAEVALAELVAAVEQYPVLVHKRIEGRPVVIAKAGDQVKVVGEDGADLTAEVPEVARAVAALKAETVELEGVLDPWHGGEVLQVQDLIFDGRDLRDWPVAKRLERLAELGIEQATASTPSRRNPVNELPTIEATDGETLERVIRVVKALPGAAGVVVKPAASFDPGEWLELEAEPVAKAEPSGPVPFVRRGSEILIGTHGGRRVERWQLEGEAAEEQIAKRRAPMAWGALRAEAIERGEAEIGAVKPWLREYFLRGEQSTERLIVRKLQVGELQKAAYSYTSCMICRAAPVVDVLWADGRGRAWFCKGCYPKWLKKRGGAEVLEVIGTKAIIGGRAPAKFSDRHNRVTTSKAAEPPAVDGGDWLAIRSSDPVPTVLQLDSVSKRWIPPLGVSALPQSVADQVPIDLAYWQAGTLAEARELRDRLVSKLDTGEVELDYAIPKTLVTVSEPDTHTKTNPVELFVSIAKIDTDRQIVTGIVLEPGEVDAQNDTVSDEVIERASINFLSRYNSETQLGFMHKVFGEIGLQLAASWVALSDQKLGGKNVKRGSWLMSVKVVDPKLWARVKKGEFTGFSIGGVAKVR